jgi:hypothetical protein
MAALLAVGVACTTPAAGNPDVAAPADQALATGGSGSGGTTATTGSGGQTVTGGDGGASGGSGGATGGASGAGGSAGRGGSTGRDAGSGGAGKDAAPGDTSGTAGDGGALACDDITSPERLGVYYYSNSEATGSSIQMYFDIVNFTAYSVRLSQVTIRYWFTDEGTGQANVLEQYYVPLPTTMKFVTLNPPREGADTVLEVSYTAAGDAGGSFVETRGFNFAFHKASYSGTYDQTNDYSYDPTLKTSLGQNPKITAYINGALAWGCEPPPLPPGG